MALKGLGGFVSKNTVKNKEIEPEVRVEEPVRVSHNHQVYDERGVREFQRENVYDINRQDVRDVEYQGTSTRNNRQRDYDYEYDNRRIETEVRAVSNPKKVALYGTDNFLLSILGRSSADGVKVVKYEDAPEVTPIKISKIKDRDNRINSKLLRLMDVTGCTVLPLRECGVFTGIEGLRDFDIIEHASKEYASYKGSNYSIGFRDKLIDSIVNKITNAELFGLTEDPDTLKVILNPKEAIVTREFSLSGVGKILVPGLCVSELKYIHEYLKFYNPSTITLDDSFPILTVGMSMGIEMELE